jgi:hypothetical protein
MKRNLLPVFALFTLLVPASLVASDDSLTTAVFSKVKNGYQRQKLPDGSFKPEYYAISNGGFQSGLTKDTSLEAVQFPAVAGVVAQHLAKRNYFLAKDAKTADLLLVVSWGETIPFSDGTYRNQIDQLSSAVNNVAMTKVKTPQNLSLEGIQSEGESVAQSARSEMEGELLAMQSANEARNRANEANANLLGYLEEINSVNDPRRFAGGGTYYDDLVSDIENPRYYVIIAAYDFRAAVEHKQRKLLWSTRVSIQAQGNRFDERLMAMMNNASKHFGQDSGRLVRQFEQAPRVDLGELQFLGVVSDEAAKAKKP